MNNVLKNSIFYATLLGGVVTISGCTSEAESGQVWQVTALAVEDLCNDPTVPYQETFDYRLQFDGPSAKIFIDDGTFAAGVVSGCDIVYETVVWSEKRDEGSIRWQLTGSASIYTGGDSCLIDGGKDWVGTEVVTVVYSDIPGIDAGCTYSLELEGVYQGIVGE